MTLGEGIGSGVFFPPGEDFSIFIAGGGGGGRGSTVGSWMTGSCLTGV